MVTRQWRGAGYLWGGTCLHRAAQMLNGHSCVKLKSVLSWKCSLSRAVQMSTPPSMRWAFRQLEPTGWLPEALHPALWTCPYEPRFLAATTLISSYPSIPSHPRDHPLDVFLLAKIPLNRGHIKRNASIKPDQGCHKGITTFQCSPPNLNHDQVRRNWLSQLQITLLA